jgi:hypothetical protein
MERGCVYDTLIISKACLECVRYRCSLKLNMAEHTRVGVALPVFNGERHWLRCYGHLLREQLSPRKAFHFAIGLVAIVEPRALIVARGAKRKIFGHALKGLVQAEEFSPGPAILDTDPLAAGRQRRPLTPIETPRQTVELYRSSPDTNRDSTEPRGMADEEPRFDRFKAKVILKALLTYATWYARPAPAGS